MNIYMDTSSLLKLYHAEDGTDELDKFLEDHPVEGIFLSEISKIEFDSAVWKKVRMKDLDINGAEEIVESFESDYANYTFIQVENQLILQARALVSKHGTEGLRTLDALQLASAITIRNTIALAITADNLLGSLMQKEGIKVK